MLIPLPAFIIALASRPIVLPVTCHNVRLKLIPVVIGKANFVVCVLRPDATPLDASLHQLYVGKPKAFIGQPPVSRLQIFSARVMRLTASLARTSIGSVLLQKGILDCGEPGTMQGLYSSLAHAAPGGLLQKVVLQHGGGGGGGFGVGTGAPEQVKENTSRASLPPHFSLGLLEQVMVQPFEALAPALTAAPHMHCVANSTPANGIFLSEQSCAQYSRVMPPS